MVPLTNSSESHPQPSSIKSLKRSISSVSFGTLHFAISACVISKNINLGGIECGHKLQKLRIICTLYHLLHGNFAELRRIHSRINSSPRPDISTFIQLKLHLRENNEHCHWINFVIPGLLNTQQEIFQNCIREAGNTILEYKSKYGKDKISRKLAYHISK